MKLRIGNSLVAAATAVVLSAGGAVSLWYWLAGQQAPAMAARLPSTSPAPAASREPVVNLRGFFVKGEATAGTSPGSWAQFRGPNRDGVSIEPVKLARSWPADGPKRLWSVDLGDGYAGPVVSEGRVYILDYDSAKKADVLRCMSLDDGKEIWRRGYQVNVPRQHGMSRTTPAVADGVVVSLGPKCHVLCADARTGDFKWGMDLVRQYGSKVPPWYAGQCPLIENGKAILAPAGPSALMIAVDCRTGEVVWETPNPHNWQMTHSSIMPVKVGERRMYVYAASGGVVGVSPEDGSILWELPGWTVPKANVPTPVPVGDGRIFLCGGYEAGSCMMKVEKNTGDRHQFPEQQRQEIGASPQYTARELFRLPQEIFGCEQQTPVLWQGHIYGSLTQNAGNAKNELVCLNLDGKQLWSSGRDNRFGPYGGPYMLADGMILIMNDDGLLTLVEATPAGYRQLARAKVLPGHESWAPMALAGGRLLVRDINKMVCLDMRDAREEATK